MPAHVAGRCEEGCWQGNACLFGGGGKSIQNTGAAFCHAWSFGVGSCAQCWFRSPNNLQLESNDRSYNERSEVATRVSLQPSPVLVQTLSSMFACHAKTMRRKALQQILLVQTVGGHFDEFSGLFGLLHYRLRLVPRSNINSRFNRWCWLFSPPETLIQKHTPHLTHMSPQGGVAPQVLGHQLPPPPP